MMKLVADGASVLFAVIVVGFAVRKWHVIRNRQSMLSAIRIALKERKAFWTGMLAGVFYLALFMILGGKGGRIHILFGRLIFNTTAAEVVPGLFLAFLVMISVGLFVYRMQLKAFKKPGKEGGIGIFGAFLAVLAAFCP